MPATPRSSLLAAKLFARRAVVALACMGAVLATRSATTAAGAAQAAAPYAPTTPVAYQVAATHPRILLNDQGFKARLTQRLSQRTLAASRFAAIVDKQLLGGQEYGFQPWFAALIYQLDANERYALYAVAQTEAFVASAEARIARGERPLVAGDSYLEVGDIVGNLALVYDWCHALLTPAQRTRWVAYANQAVANVWSPKSARWGNTVYPWTGWSVDNPSNNYYYSFLRATMLLGLATHGEDAQAQGWLKQFRQTKLEEQLLPTFERDLTGGGSREGTGYGTSLRGLFQLYDWCHALLTPEQRARWVAYANQAVANVWSPKAARWGGTLHPWTGWSVDNPANNYYYSFLRATMLLGLATHGENPQAQAWLKQFRQTKIEEQLLPTFERDLNGGGSREGTGYGTALRSLYLLYHWWERSTGERLASRTGHTLASLAHFIHSTVPTFNRLAPTGDHARDSSAALFDYHRDMLLLLMALYPQAPLAAAAGELLAASSVPRAQYGFNAVSDFLYEPAPPASTPVLPTLNTTYWAPGTGQLMMRSGWTSDATYANFICGPYTESHAHRDQGSFVVYKRQWWALDANLYSHSGIEQAEDMHNLVRFDAAGATVKQTYNSSCQLAALATQPHYTYALAQITPVYRGRKQVVNAEREFVFIQPDVFVVFDRAMARQAEVQRVFTLNLPEPPQVEGTHIALRQAGGRFDVLRLAPQGVTTSVLDWTQAGRGLKGGARIDVAHAQGQSSQFLHVLALDGAVRSAQRADVGGRIGAAVTLADGRRLHLLFSANASGGSIQLRDAQGGVLVDEALPTGVAKLPVFKQ